MKTGIKKATVLMLALVIMMGVMPQPVPVQGHTPSPMHSAFVKTGYDKSSASSTPVQTSQKLSPNATSANGLVTLGAWRNMRPTESYLRDVSMLPASVAADIDCSSIDQQSKGWIVGDAGVILAYCHGIWDHAITTELIPTSLYGVAAVTPTLAFAVGENGTIEQYGWDTIEQKYVWVKLPIQVSQHTLNRISVVPNGTGYFAWVVGDQDPNLKRSTLVRGDIVKMPGEDPNHNPIYKANWTNVTNLYGSLPQTDMYFGVQVLNPNDAWTVAADYVNWKGLAMHWNGSTWTSFPVGNDPLYGVFFRSSNDGWAVGEGGGIYHFDGSIWSKAVSPFTTAFADVSFDASGVGWAVGFDGIIAKFSNQTWSQFTDLRTDYFDFYAMDHTSGHGWLVGYNDSKTNGSYGIGGQILEYAENAWLSVTIPTDNSLNDLAVLSDTNAWAVGAADKYGATIIHWDGRHWQRWYQKELPLPKGDLFAIDMLSPTNGWAAGEPPSAEAPAIFLHWDGIRWSPPRYEAPVNVRVNALRLIRTDSGGGNMADFGWAVADSGNAVAKLDYTTNYWNANHTYGGWYYQLRGLSLIHSTDFISQGRDWDAWSVGEYQSGGKYYETYMRFLSEPFPSTGYSWQQVASPPACPNGDKGDEKTDLFGIRMLPPTVDFPILSGFSAGHYDHRASIYYYDGSNWNNIFCQDPTVSNPSQFNSVDVFEDTHIAWLGGFYTNQAGTKLAFIAYVDQGGYTWGGVPYPLNGRNIYDRPITKLRMSSETMGWAVGEREDPRKISSLYQYPYPNFTLDLTPPIQAVRPGSSVDFTASLSSLGSIDNSVSLSTIYSPPGFTVQLNPATVSTSTSTNIHVAVGSSVTPGTYSILIQGYALITSGDAQLPMYRTTSLTVIVTNHPVQNVSPALGPAGTVVTITGQNFGIVPAGQRSTTNNRVILAGAIMPDSSIITWTDTSIQVLVPDNHVLFPDGPVKGIVQVTSNAGGPVGVSNSNLEFQYENKITSVSALLQNGLSVITLVGTGFGSDPGLLQRNTVYEHITFDGSPIEYFNVISWENNQVVFQTPLTLPQLVGKKMTLTSNGYNSNEMVYGGLGIYIPLLRH